MTTSIILGSGPAAAGVALALSPQPDLRIRVLDIGLELEDDRRDTVRLLASTDRAEWSDQQLRTITAQPVRHGGQLPEKRSYGSDFPFRDVGQLARILTLDGTNEKLISGAYGGFSNVWGTQIMPFSPATFDQWPVSLAEMRTHYAAILDAIPFAGEEDDLATLFPLIGSPTPLPEISARTRRVLDAYDRSRAKLNRIGITIGKARLAFAASNCVRCGMCMTGCPYGLLYSASQTFDRLRAAGRIDYHRDLMAVRVGEEEGRPFVYARETTTGRIQRFDADRLFVACGAVSSSRIVLNSLHIFDTELSMGESVQFILPTMSRVGVPDPRHEAQFTLNQFNMVIALDDVGLDLSQLHFYTYNQAFIDALPAVLRRGSAHAATGRLLGHLAVALGYLPSWASPRLRLRAQPGPTNDELPTLTVWRDDERWHRNGMLRDIVTRLVRAAPGLDLFPVLPMLRLAKGGKSYHWGGSFPHQQVRTGQFSSDRLGRVGPWQRIHMVDAAVFPNVPATTFTLTIMANAHRIATEATA